MFASHMTMSEAACGFEPMLARYSRITQQFSEAEADSLFHRVADLWFRPE